MDKTVDTNKANPHKEYKRIPNPFTHPQEFFDIVWKAKMGTTNTTAIVPPTVSYEDPLADNTDYSSINPFVDPNGFLVLVEQRRQEWSELLDATMDIAVVEVMMEIGGIGSQDGDPNKYKLNGDNVQINGQQWYNFNADEGSVGPISFVQSFVGGINRKEEAVTWLSKCFKDRIGTDEIKSSIRNQGLVKKKASFVPPQNAPQFLDNIRTYLHEKRGIDKDLIERMISEGRIYSDPYKNVVMISKTGKIAELRGTEPYKDKRTGEWKEVKILVPGSDKNSGAFMVIPDKEKVNGSELAQEKAFGIVESGIDALSYHMLFPGRGVASASGASFTYPRRLFFEALENGYSFHCAFDADQAGDKASQNIYNTALLFDHFKEHHNIQNSVEFIGLFNRKILRLKLRPELNKSESIVDEDDDVMDEGLYSNVLFFNSEDPFKDSKNCPVVLYDVKYNTLGIPTGSFEIKVTPELHQRIVSEFRLHRDRPQNQKDWNAIMKPNSHNMPKFN